MPDNSSKLPFTSLPSLHLSPLSIPTTTIKPSDVTPTKSRKEKKGNSKAEFAWKPTIKPSACLLFSVRLITAFNRTMPEKHEIEAKFKGNA
jgi:hypothetical protein